MVELMLGLGVFVSCDWWRSPMFRASHRASRKYDPSAKGLENRDTQYVE